MKNQFRDWFSLRIYSCMMTFMSGLGYSLSDDPLFRLLAISAMLVWSEIMVMVWVPTLVDGIAFNFKMAKMKRLDWEFPLVFLETAKSCKVRLNKDRPLVMIENLDNAYANINTSQIALGSSLFNRVGDRERLALFGHELTHIKFAPLSYALLILISFLVMLIHEVFNSHNNPDIVTFLTISSIFLLCITAVSWVNELVADAGAKRIAGKIAMVKLLLKLRPKEKRSINSISHPSIAIRIKRILSS